MEGQSDRVIVNLYLLCLSIPPSLCLSVSVSPSHLLFVIFSSSSIA